MDGYGVDLKTNRWKIIVAQESYSPGALTIDPQAVLQLGATRHIGRHTAVAPGVRKPGSLNAENSPVSRHRDALPSRDRLAALEPGDVCGREERHWGPARPSDRAVCRAVLLREDQGREEARG